MATAKNLYFGDNAAPNIDVYTALVVVYEGEAFDWVISGQDHQSFVQVQKVPGQNWPFSSNSFDVNLGAGTPATVPAGTAGTYQFQCNPAAAVTPQALIVAKVYGQCGDPMGKAGSWFAWQNTAGGAIVIKAKSGGNLPLAGNPSQVVIPANSTQVFQIDQNASVGDYPVIPSLQANGSGVCTQAGDPKIVVGTTEP